nr:putative reverse transcriptase domain, ribonuclease H-like domain, aspartic peptidase domain protein [Tanacetum cinerariifolium]
NKTYVWGDKQDEAFRILKEKLCNAPVLALPDGPNDYVVYCDASKQGFGCVLMQRGKVIAYASRQLKTHENNYTTHDSKLGGGSSCSVTMNVRSNTTRARRIWWQMPLVEKKGSSQGEYSITIHSGLKTKILEAQGEASKDLKALAEWLRGLETHFERRDDGGIYFFDRIWISSVGGIKAEHQKPSGLLQRPEIPEWKWEKLAMDLVTKFSRSSSGYDAIWVVVDRLTKSAHFLPIREDYKTEKLERIYINKIVARHGVPVSIISDPYHPETDGQSERTIQTLKDMLRACVLDFGGSWDTHLPLVEFSYNNSYYTSIKCAPFEALYGRKCRSPVIWTEVGESQLVGLEIVQEMTEKIIQIKERLKTAMSRQKSYADKRRKPLELKVGDRVLLKVSPWKGVVRFGKKGKLAPRFIENFSKIAKPLTLLTQKNKTYVWGDKQDEAFRILKEKLCNAPVLALLDGPNDYLVYCDASKQGFGCVLMQRDKGEASKDLKALAEWLRGLETHFEQRDNGGIYFFDRIWIPSVGGVRKLIMDEAHTSRYSIHPGADKMYCDLRDLYWWPGMKRDIAKYVSRCLTCSKIKAEHQKPSGLLQQPEIPEWNGKR